MPETVKCVYYAWISQKDLLILLEYQFSLEHKFICRKINFFTESETEPI